MPKTSLLGNSLIWFGAGVSIAEIYTGALLAPLGFGKAAAAILIGHVIGCSLLFGAGWIGAKYRAAAMETVKRSFGGKGGHFFALLNLMQLAGWSAVMIAAGSVSANELIRLDPRMWACIIGALIALWTFLKSTELKILNTAAIVLLFALSILLGAIVFRHEPVPAEVPAVVPGFGQALEMCIAMPLSWLPLIADYTCTSDRPKAVSVLCAGVYFLVSSWMFVIGLGAAQFAGSADITLILAKAGLGIPALVIVVLSTVTATYLDVYSSEMSVSSITSRIPPKATGFTVCLCGVLLAIFCNTAAFTEFLYWIGSVFAPMIAIQLTDFFLLKQRNTADHALCASSLTVWALGFLLYRILLAMDPVCGSTLPVMIVTALLHIAGRRLAAHRPVRS